MPKTKLIVEVERLPGDALSEREIDEIIRLQIERLLKMAFEPDWRITMVLG